MLWYLILTLIPLQLLGVEEAKERGDLDQIPALKDATTLDDEYEYCLKLATKIESGMWVYFNESIVFFYSLTLFRTKITLLSIDNS